MFASLQTAAPRSGFDYTPTSRQAKSVSMSDSVLSPLTDFVEHVMRQLAKNGFPERPVSFPIERMYESAAAKGVSFNNVLDALRERGITHEKTPEKVIFLPATSAPSSPDANAFAGLDPSMFAGLSKDQLLAAAQTAMSQMGPDQLAAVRAMLEGMTPEQQAQMVEQARKLGLV